MAQHLRHGGAPLRAHTLIYGISFPMYDLHEGERKRSFSPYQIREAIRTLARLSFHSYPVLNQQIKNALQCQFQVLHKMLAQRARNTDVSHCHRIRRLNIYLPGPSESELANIGQEVAPRKIKPARWGRLLQVGVERASLSSEWYRRG